jgi:hypothetical protein
MHMQGLKITMAYQRDVWCGRPTQRIGQPTQRVMCYRHGRLRQVRRRVAGRRQLRRRAEPRAGIGVADGTIQPWASLSLISHLH